MEVNGSPADLEAADHSGLSVAGDEAEVRVGPGRERHCERRLLPRVDDRAVRSSDVLDIEVVGDLAAVRLIERDGAARDRTRREREAVLVLVDGNRRRLRVRAGRGGPPTAA